MIEFVGLCNRSASKIGSELHQTNQRHIPALGDHEQPDLEVGYVLLITSFISGCCLGLFD